MRKILILIVFVYLSNTLLSQQRWMKTYLPHLDPTCQDLKISYDGGFLLSGRHKPNYPRYNYLLKTDINGEVLWEKTFGDGVNVILPGGLGMNNDGDIYFSGSYGEVGAYADPLVMKLNACGEKEWCYLFPTEGHHDYGYDLAVSPNGGVAFIIAYSGIDYSDDRVCLAKFTKEGEFLWKKCYNLPDSVSMNNEIMNDVISTPDSGFLMTGFCYYSNPEDSLTAYLSPYYIKTDSEGEMEWYVISGANPYNIDGEGFQTVLSPDSSFYYSGIQHKYWNDNYWGKQSAAILKVDLEGNIINNYDISSPMDIGFIPRLNFFNDSTIISAGFWGNGNSADNRLVLLDTTANIIEQKILVETDRVGETNVTSDGKILYFIEDVDDNDHFEVFLFKVNEELDGDTIYTLPFTYDSLCPYQVQSDTIAIEGCGLILGNTEIYPETKPKDILEVFPNPTSKSFTVKSTHLESGGVLQLINMQGQIALQANIPSGTTNYEVDVSDLMKGIYLVKFKSDKGKEISTKLIVN